MKQIFLFFLTLIPFYLISSDNHNELLRKKIFAPHQHEYIPCIPIYFQSYDTKNGYLVSMHFLKKSSFNTSYKNHLDIKTILNAVRDTRSKKEYNIALIYGDSTTWRSFYVLYNISHMPKGFEKTGMFSNIQNPTQEDTEEQRALIIKSLGITPAENPTQEDIDE